MLDIKIYNNKDVLVAENKGIAGNWTDNSINSISLDLKNSFKQSDLSGGKVRLDISPAGKDKWEFDYNISVTYSDNTVIWERWNGKVLTQDKPDNDRHVDREIAKPATFQTGRAKEPIHSDFARRL